MDNVKDVKKQEKKTFPADVVKIIDNYKIVINRGSLHDVKEGQRFLLYNLSKEEIKDPSTGESLGYLEIVKGTGDVIHVQEQISIIESDRTSPPQRRIVRRKPSIGLAILGAEEEEIIESPKNVVPFDEPKIGDKAKPIW